jgi:very-short-patch-repair endonuclease
MDKSKLELLKRGALFSSGMRSKPTQAERVLRDAIIKQGYWFKFQSWFYDNKCLFIPDFRLALESQKLIIEVDDPSHEYKRGYDARRTNWMKANRNCLVLRFTNQQVLTDLESVMAEIDTWQPKKLGAHNCPVKSQRKLESTARFFNRLKETIEREREQVKVQIDELDAQFQRHL